MQVPTPSTANDPSQDHSGVSTTSGTAFTSPDWRPPTTTCVTFLHYPFLSVSNIHSMLPADINHVESQGCFRVPGRSVLGQLVQQYFRYVHPILPLMDEGDFWDMYHGRSTKIPAPNTHLVLLQAMLFAACTVSSVTHPLMSTEQGKSTESNRDALIVRHN